MLRFCKKKPRPSAEFLLATSTVEGDPTKDLEEPNTASIRWAVVIGDDAGDHLQQQSLPAGAPTLNGNPLLRK
jgi:hypothetical protein